GRNSSYCPRTRLAMYARIAPTCMPVTREPTACTTMLPAPPRGPGARRSVICSISGSSTTRKPSTFARIHPGRSTIVAGSGSSSDAMPVNSRTWPWAIFDSARSSATASRASAWLTCGPGLTSRVPAWTATFQSIIEALMYSTVRSGRGAGAPLHSRLTNNRRGYLPYDRVHTRSASGRGRVAAAAGGDGGCEPVEFPWVDRALAVPGHEGEREKPAVGVMREPRKRADPRQSAGLGADHPQPRQALRRHEARRAQRPGEPGD